MNKDLIYDNQEGYFKSLNIFHLPIPDLQPVTSVFHTKKNVVGHRKKIMNQF